MGECSSPAAWIDPRGKVVCLPPGSTHAKVAARLLRRTSTRPTKAADALLRRGWVRKAWTCEYAVWRLSGAARDGIIEDAARDGWEQD